MKPIELLAAFLKAYEAKDVKAIAVMLADDVRLQDWNLTAQGKQAVLDETSKNFLDAERLQIEIQQLYGGERCAAAQWRIVVNRTIELEVVDTIALNADGQICSLRAHKGWRPGWQPTELLEAAA